MKTIKYPGPTHNILAIPDHYVGLAHTFEKDDAAAVTVDGRKIIKAGTIYPTNDADAVGVVFQDVDVTDGDREGSLIRHGFILVEKLPVAPDAAAITKLKLIDFVEEFV